MDYLWLYDLLFIAGYLERQPLNLQSARDTILYKVVQKNKKTTVTDLLFNLCVSREKSLRTERERARVRERDRQIETETYLYIGIYDISKGERL